MARADAQGALSRQAEHRRRGDGGGVVDDVGIMEVMERVREQFGKELFRAAPMSARSSTPTSPTTS